MKTKIEIQNELIDAIIDWNNKGKTLGYSKAQELINEYERQVKLFAIPVVMQRSELLLFADYYENDKTSETTDEVVDNYLAEKSNSA